MSGHGGKRKGAGRPVGARNKATAAQRATLSELARSYAALALETLAEVARSSESDAARVSAACALLDRAYGRPGPASEPARDKNGSLSKWLAEINARGSAAPLADREDKT